MSEALGLSNKQRIEQKCFFTFGEIQAYYRDPASRMPFPVKEAMSEALGSSNTQRIVQKWFYKI